MTFRTNIILFSLSHHAFRDHFYYFSTNQKRDLYYLSEYYMFHYISCFVYTHAAMIQTTVEILQTLQFHCINLRFIAKRIIKYLCGMQKQSIAIYFFSIAIFYSGRSTTEQVQCKHSQHRIVEMLQQNLMVNFSVLFLYGKVFCK